MELLSVEEITARIKKGPNLAEDPQLRNSIWSLCTKHKLALRTIENLGREKDELLKQAIANKPANPEISEEEKSWSRDYPNKGFRST